MVLVRTDLGNTKESAHRERFEPTSQNSATNVQQAIANLGAGGGSITGPGSSTVNDFAIWNNTSGTLLADATPTVATALLNVFTSGLKGLAPASGGGTTNFLRADGTWAAPGGGGLPGGSNKQFQYDNAGAFGGANVWRTTADQTDFSDGVTAQAVRIYNTTDNNGGTPTNAEWATFDWTTTANVLTIGPQASGTGVTTRGINFIQGGAVRMDLGVTNNGTLQINAAVLFNVGPSGNGFALTGLNDRILMNTFGTPQIGFTSTQVLLNNNVVQGWTAGAVNGGTADIALSRAAAGVVAIGTGAAQNTAGWLNWVGETRVTADVTATSTTTLATVTGLSVALQAGRTYSFVAELSWTDAAAGGLQLAMVASGGLTATNIIYDGYIIDSAANGIKGNAQATALGGVVASATTTGTAGHARISGAITVNVAGTINLQFAQNTSNATATTIKRGSYMIVQDMP